MAGCHELVAAEAKTNCKFCGMKLCDGASFCTICGNVANGICSVTDWCGFNGGSRAKCRMTLVQKMVLGLVAVFAIYGGYVKWRGKCMALVPGFRSQSAVGSSDVSKAEYRLRALKRSFAEEDARKKKEAAEAEEMFRRQVEEARSLDEEFSGKERK